MRLKNKTALITGGASGIGKATCLNMIEEGARVVFIDRNKEKGLELVQKLKEHKKEIIFIETDLKNEVEVIKASQTFDKHFSKLDIIFNNVGTGNMIPTEQMTLQQWQEIIDINLTSVFLISKYFIKFIRKNGGGSIINCASILGNVSRATAGAYSASKSGIINFTRSLALEYAPFKIRVNCISPGYINTPMLQGLNESAKNYLNSLHPLGRIGEPEEIAKTVSFLASDDASFITGANLMVDGGYTIQ